MTTTHHFLQVVSDDGEAPSLRLVCTAPPDAACRRRPVDPGLESLTDEDETTPGHECGAVEWIEDAGWESIATETDGILSSVGVRVYYDDGPVISPVSSEQPAAERMGTERPGAENADTSGTSAEPSDAEVQAAAEAIARCTFPDKGWWELSPWKREYNTKRARAALVAARKVVARHE